MLTVKARGKINWRLKITGKRPDHYHLMDMVMQSVSLFDLLSFSPLEGDKISITTENLTESLDPENNLIYKAATLLNHTFGLTKGVHIHLEKNIPVGAGLGGGSADAAATLVALNQLWQLNLPADELMKIALPLGADVPFCIKGGLQHAQGIGENLTSYPIDKSYHLIIIKPPKGLDTKEVFTAFSFQNSPSSSQSALLIKALQQENFSVICQTMDNDLQPVSNGFCPDIQRACKDLLHHGALQAVMTGSGSAVIGLFQSKEKAQRSFETLRTCWSQCYLAQTCNQGLTFMP